MAFRKDDPLYYKHAMQKLITQAKENGLEIRLDEKGSMLYFTSDIGECVGYRFKD